MKFNLGGVRRLKINLVDLKTISSHQLWPAFKKLLIPEIIVRLTRRSPRPCSKVSVFMILKAEEELMYMSSWEIR